MHLFQKKLNKKFAIFVVSQKLDKIPLVLKYYSDYMNFIEFIHLYIYKIIIKIYDFTLFKLNYLNFNYFTIFKLEF